MNDRHFVLAFYCAWNAAVQFEWLRFAPIARDAAKQYNVSVGGIGFLAMLFPVVFLVLAMPVGRLLGRIEIRTALRAISVLMVSGALVRLGTSSFAGLVIGQTLIATTQAVMISLIANIAAIWFKEDQRLVATSLGTMSIFGGIALALLLVPMSASAIGPSLRIDALVLGGLAAATWLLVPVDPRRIQSVGEVPWWPATRKLLKTPAIGAALALMFLGDGVFNALFIWLEPMFAQRGINAELAGRIGLLMLGGGLIGMVGMGHVGLPERRLHMLIVVAAIVALPLTAMLLQAKSMLVIGISAVLLGALILSPLPLLVEVVSLAAGEKLASSAVGLFWMAGNAGSAAVIALMSVLADRGADGVIGWVLLPILACEALIAGLFLRFVPGRYRSTRNSI
ncbi:MFS transporter [Solimonas sp. K1W22B-7]|uniref:MFS transporter n=1 Tax=Solimonas sp. K1W22B-7 TaxID=2303331 RepID=UPI000E334D58|nr:MFS transporter [Solimonas sp. K1W22B-7]AXQ30097.1 MFS transporter [Solimonas sp. K1W22B-7]